MNDEQIVEYAKKLVINNLHQYVDTNPQVILNEIFELQSEKTNQKLLEHLIGLDELIKVAIKIIKKGNKK